jgi:hypothetical protein
MLAAFIGFVGIVLTLYVPKPDDITIDFGAIASSYGGTLVGLGGISITVLAVLLGLDALEKDDTSVIRRVSHQAAIRHVAISLAMATITCFVSANMLSEVQALNNGIISSKVRLKESIANQMRAEGVTDRLIAARAADLDRIEESALRFDRPTTTVAADPTYQTLGASVRRHFVLAGVSAYVASILLLQSLGFLLLIRFPHDERLHRLQNFGVMSITALIMIKLVYTASAGLTSTEFYVSRVALVLILAATCILYGRSTRQTVRRLEDANDPTLIRAHTPLLPYFSGLSVSLVSMLALMATFGDTGLPTRLDQAIVIIGTAITTGLFLIVQVERPSIHVLVDADHDTEKSRR